MVIGINGQPGVVAVKIVLAASKKELVFVMTQNLKGVVNNAMVLPISKIVVTSNHVV